jgi:indole-3-glycerol phosphate synthase
VRRRRGRSQQRNILDTIVASRRQTLAKAQKQLPAAELEQRAARAAPPRDFRAAISRNSINIIAELKKASPSRGVLRTSFDPLALAQDLAQAGASALSVLTEPEFFQGSLEQLTQARQAVSIPVLRKDFVFDPYQVLEARAAGADAFLLIVAILTAGELRRLITFGRELGMAALVEISSRTELEQALAAGADIIGVNNRNLQTLEVNPETSFRLIEEIPDSCLAVSESGLHSGTQLQELRAAGFDAFLIGEHLMEAKDPAQALRELLSEPLPHPALSPTQ